MALKFMVAVHLGIEVRKHHFCFGLDGLGLSFHVAAQHLLGTLGFVFRIALDAFGEFVVTAVGGVVSEHVQNESFLDGLLHAVEVEGMELAFFILCAEALQGFFLGRCGEGEVGAVLTHLTVSHQLLQQGVGIASVLVGIFLYGSIQFVCCNA